MRPVADDRGGHDRAGEGHAGDGEERRLHAAGLLDRRQRQRGERAADRDRRLPDPERGPRCSAGNQAMTARPLAEFTLEPAAPASARMRTAGEARRERRRREAQAAEPDPGRDRRALADAVGEQAPRQQRERRADPRGGEDDADLRQRQVELVAERGRERGQADADDREADLGPGAGGEDGPAVSAQSPNGL